MKVLIDAHMLGKKEGGNERYIQNLWPEVAKRKNIELYLYLPKDFKIKTKKVKRLNSVDNDIVRLASDLSSKADSKGVDIIHSTYISPFVTSKKKVIMVHDFSFKKHPEFFSFKELFIFNVLLPISIKEASAIVVPSEFTKKEFEKYYPKYSKKVFVSQEAASKIFSLVAKNIALKEVERSFSVKKPYFLSINSKYKRKNINRLIEAFFEVKKENREISLIIVGGGDNISFKNREVEGLFVLDYTSDEELNFLYNASEALIYPSLYEGFGLPLLEAMKVKTPVLCSNIKVHKEIAKEAALYFNPLSVKDIKKAMNRILEDTKLSESLVKEGVKVEKKYSWTKTAKDTIKAYRFAQNN